MKSHLPLRQGPQDLEEAVKKAVRTSVLRSKDKLGPMTRAELVGRIGLSSKACELAISYAKRRLVGTFGLELVETTKVTPESSKKTTGQRVLIVRSALPQGLLEGVEAADDGLNAFRGLGYTIGQFIAHDGEGEGMNEQAMWDLLRRLGIRQEDKDHPTFGSVKDAVEKLFKNRWLVRTGTSGQDTSGNKVQIGEALLGLVSPDGSHEEGIKALREHAKSIQISPQEAAGRDDDDGGEECDDDGGGEVIEIE